MPNNAGQLVTFRVAGVIRSVATYDGFRRLVTRRLVNGTPSFIQHLVHDTTGRIIAETAGGFTTTREYLWLGDVPVAVVDGVDTATPVLRFVHVDHIGRPILMTDAARAPVWRASFRPFGEAHAITGPAALDLRFPGQWFQLESGLAYNWHRTYDPTLGRYVQPDPLGLLGLVNLQDGPNLYGYARQSPLFYVDPDGRFWQVFVAGAVVGLALDFLSQWIESPEGQFCWDPFRSGVSAVLGGLGARFLPRYPPIKVPPINRPPNLEWSHFIPQRYGRQGYVPKSIVDSRLNGKYLTPYDHAMNDPHRMLRGMTRATARNPLPIRIVNRVPDWFWGGIGGGAVTGGIYSD